MGDLPKGLVILPIEAHATDSIFGDLKTATVIMRGESHKFRYATFNSDDMAKVPDCACGSVFKWATKHGYALSMIIITDGALSSCRDKRTNVFNDIFFENNAMKYKGPLVVFDEYKEIDLNEFINLLKIKQPTAILESATDNN